MGNNNIRELYFTVSRKVLKTPICCKAEMDEDKDVFVSNIYGEEKRIPYAEDLL